MPEEHAIDTLLGKMQAGEEMTLDPPAEPAAEQPVSEPETAQETPSAPETTPEPEAPAETPTETPSEPAAEEAPPEEEPADDGPKFGYEREDDAPAEDEGFDEAAFDKETEKQTESLDPKERDAWKKLRAQVKEAKAQQKQADELKSQLDEAKEKAARVEEMEARMEQLTGEYYEVKARNEAEYKEKYEQPVKEVADNLDKLADTYGIPAATLVEIMKTDNPRARRQMVQKVLPNENEEGEEIEGAMEDRSDLVLAMASLGKQYQSALSEQSRILSNAKDEYEKIEAQKSEQAQKEREEAAKQRRTHLAGFRSELAEIPAFAEDGRYGTAVDRDIKAAASMSISEMSQRDQAYAIFAGAALPSMSAELARLRKALGEKEDNVRREQASSPNVSAGTTPGENEKPAPLDWDSAINKYLK